MLPLSSDWHDEDEEEAPPPPPPPTQEMVEVNRPSSVAAASDLASASSDQVGGSDSDEELPIVPAAYVAAIQQRLSQSMLTSPAAPSSVFVEEATMSLPTSSDARSPSRQLVDEDDAEGEDDSDVESATNGQSRLQPSSFSPPHNEYSIHDVLAPLRELRDQQLRQEQHPKSSHDQTIGKLSFTAPSLSSPLSQSSPDSFSLSFPSASVASPSHSSGSTSSSSSASSARIGVDVASLSNHLSVQVELQSFAKARKKSLIMSGVSDQSLIPQSLALSREPRPSRRSNNIRSMSLSVSHGATAAWLANASPAYTALKTAKRLKTTLTKEQHVEEILDLFGDGPARSSSGTAAIAMKPLGPLPASILQQSNAQSFLSASALVPASHLHSIPESSFKTPASATPLSTNFDSGDDEPTPSTKIDPNTPSSIPPPPPSHVDMDEIDNETPPPPPPPLPVSFLGDPASTTSNTSTTSDTTSADKAPAQSHFSTSTSINSSSVISNKLGSDDLTSTFVPPRFSHIAAVFPWRKIVRSNQRSTECLLQPVADATDAQLQSQTSVLGFLAEAMKVRRADFQSLFIDQLRLENEALKQLLADVNTAVQPERRSFGVSPVASDAVSHDQLRRSFVKVCSHARRNTSLHQRVTAEHLALEDGKRKLRMRWTRIIGEEKKESFVIDQRPSSLLQRSIVDSKDLPTNHAPPSTSRSPIDVVPAFPSFTRPMVSLAEISSKARSIGLGLGGNASNEWSSARDLNSSFVSPNLSASPAPVSFAASSSQGVPLSAASPLLTSTMSTNAQLQRFAITKINMIRKNTPRVLEMDLTTKTMTICKSKGSSSSTRNYEDYEFSNRDIVITPGSIVNAELHAKNELQLDMSFIIKSSTQSSSSSQSFLNISPLSTQQTTIKSKEKGQIVKNWKILFNSSGEREKFYRLLQVTLLTPERDTDTRRGSAHTNIAAPLFTTATSDPTKRQPGLEGDQPVSSLTSTVYPPNPLQLNTETMLTYTPHAPALTPAILSRVRMLPLLPLASSLHTVWCLTRKHEGWKYGLKLSDINDTRKTHPFLVPFHALPTQRRDYHIKLVTATLATVLALGFVIHRPFNGEETVFDAKNKTMTAALSCGDASFINGNGTAPSASSSHMHSSLLTSTPFSIAPSSFPASSPVFAFSTSTSALAASTIAGSRVAADLLPLIDVFAESSHDLWSQEKLSLGWKWGVTYSADARTHPFLMPYSNLNAERQERERKQAFRILATLVEWGYEILKPNDSSIVGPSVTVSSGSNALAVQTQPFSGSLKKHLHSFTSLGAQATSTKVTSAMFSGPSS